MSDLEITPAEAKQRLDRGEKLLLVDVREPWEAEICRIQGAKLIPMGSIPAKGSSRRMKEGDVARARQISRSRLSPPERV